MLVYVLNKKIGQAHFVENPFCVHTCWMFLFLILCDLSLAHSLFSWTPFCTYPCACLWFKVHSIVSKFYLGNLYKRFIGLFSLYSLTHVFHTLRIHVKVTRSCKWALVWQSRNEFSLGRWGFLLILLYCWCFLGTIYIHSRNLTRSSVIW
jgi:hypothetical protein